MKRAVCVGILFYILILGALQAHATVAILQPNGQGTCGLTIFGVQSTHWQSVLKGTTSNQPYYLPNTNYVYAASTGYKNDIFEMTDFSVSNPTVSKVIIYAYMGDTYNKTDHGKLGFIIGGTPYQSSEFTINQTMGWKSYEQDLNPATGLAWTQSELSGMQVQVLINAVDSGAWVKCLAVYVEVTYTAVSLSSIVVTPSGASIYVEGTRQFLATGHYSDASSGPINDSGIWSSSDMGVATVSATGLVTGVAVGTSTIMATKDGITGSIPITVLASGNGNPGSGGGGSTVEQSYYCDWNGVTYDNEADMQAHSMIAVPGGATVFMTKKDFTFLSGGLGLMISGILTFALFKAVL